MATVLYYGDTIASFSSSTKNLVLRIFETIATSGFLTDSECTKFVFGRGSPRLLAGLRGLLLRGRGEREEKGRGIE